MYVAVKGGEQAIAAAHALLHEERRGPGDIPDLSLDQIGHQLKFAVDRVMAEASLYNPRLAALAIKQAAGDLQEAVFLLRAYRTTLPRFVPSLPVNTDRMRISRRISATWKDLPGGQILGSTFDYTHRLLDRTLVAGTETDTAAAGRTQAGADRTQAQAGHEDAASPAASAVAPDWQADGHLAPIPPVMPRAALALEQDGLLERSWSVAGPDAQAANEASDPCSLQKACQDIPDITRDPLELPCNRPEDRPLRLQMLARSDEGFLLAMAYSTQRGFGAVHPFTSELRRGFVEVSLIPEELDFPVVLGELELTECITISRYTGTACEPCFTQGYGLAFGNNERKAISMSIVDRALRAHEMEEEETGPGQNPEFVLLHGDSVDASGFVQHIKLPHYVDFQAELSLIRELRGRKTHKETDPDETNAETGNGTGTVPGNGTGSVEDAR